MGKKERDAMGEGEEKEIFRFRGFWVLGFFLKKKQTIDSNLLKILSF